MYAFLGRATALANKEAAQQLSRKQVDAQAGPSDGVAALLASIKKEKKKVRIDMDKHIQVRSWLYLTRRTCFAVFCAGRCRLEYAWHAYHACPSSGYMR